MSTTAYPHIEVNAEGVPILAGTTTKVVEIALDRLAFHWDAEEIQRQHAHLSLGQIYAALAYYYDHQSEMDEDIEARLKVVREIERNVGDSTIREKLKQSGRLP